MLNSGSTWLKAPPNTTGMPPKWTLSSALSAFVMTSLRGLLPDLKLSFCDMGALSQTISGALLMSCARCVFVEMLQGALVVSLWHSYRCRCRTQTGEGETQTGETQCNVHMRRQWQQTAHSHGLRRSGVQGGPASACSV